MRDQFVKIYTSETPSLSSQIENLRVKMKLQVHLYAQLD